MKRPPLSLLVYLVVWLAVTVLFIGLRPEHVFIAFVIVGMYVATDASRRLILALLPFIIFFVSYDWMNLCPNYHVRPIDVTDVHTAERFLFGITGMDGLRQTPNEWWAQHTNPVLDFLAGSFYLCWVPVPLLFGVYLYFSGKKKTYLHFALAFLLVNWLGFACYYAYPAAPPWYLAQYGSEAIPGTPGSVAGLGAWDQMMHLKIFDALYARNSNVFAAMPSLHSAYNLVALVYALRCKTVGWAWRIVLAIVTVGIWWAAVYTCHHYVLDVLGGITCALAGCAIFETVVMRVPACRRWMDSYIAFISKKAQ